MKYGVALPYTTPRAVAFLAQLAEESGWDGVFLGDAIWTLDPMISLAASPTGPEVFCKLSCQFR